ncbi:MAG: BMP family ABC transporter substrate-binding protein [Candidatus Heimdallarchaeota archaeon]|nr:BMP family ABC transporter substrate-binding protein [Candidatus Heimdallarchaeota archaeon]
MKKSTYSRIFLIFGILMLLVAFSGCTGPEAVKVKAGFIYVGPIGDYGWTNAHDVGRVYVDEKYSWLGTEYIETVGEDIASVKEAADTLITVKGCNVIFTTSFGFMDGTIAAAAEHPDTLFFHCSGYKRAANVGTYFADLYQMYYLNGMMAGYLSNTTKAGYVGAFPIPEVIRHINAFTLGMKAANNDSTVEVTWINSWYDPTAATSAANSLIGKGVDMLAFTEDSPAVMQAAEEEDDVYAFSHYSPMQSYAPESTISGQLAHWDIMYDEILSKVYDGTYNSTNLSDVDYLWFLKEGAVELGGNFDVPINPLFVPELQSITVGATNAYDYIMDKHDKMAAETFFPFTGPIYAQNGTLMFAAGVQATIPDLFTYMDWFVDGVIGTPG